MNWLDVIFTGLPLALFGTGLCVGLGCLGAVLGLGIVGEAGTGLMTEDPNKFAQILILQIVPSTNGIYGFVFGMLCMVKLNMFGGEMLALTFEEGLLMFGACMPLAVCVTAAAVAQSRIAAGIMSLIAKRPEDFAKGILVAVMVEFFTIVALLVSILMLFALPF